MKTFDFKTVEYKLSFKNYNDLRLFGLPEICFTGRSNVGKSSLINAITNRKAIATTSSKPGHTKKIFFFNIAKKFLLVDLPGYGFAQISKKKIERISELVSLYLTKRSDLKMVFILIDSRHGFKENDIKFLEFLHEKNISFQIVFTKADKISKKQAILLKKTRDFHKLIKDCNLFFTSSKTKLGIKDIRKQIMSILKSDG